ncbi:Scr1 family TA system antitoxin-like transcriptional regulator [Nocardiopsis sp. CT-R113]|uniref:Scr1 family TA system antitoxin-like transcriptional regulator n=1 Tax=Nocardiopsis codii TaxID=3065942 RepID=A0ABU7K3Y2_9ACTN|nr:Scr1 family TA system antitoxin-like transcriptional regulator [Nocardiopsis sp. CT-R113]MEE2036948.1 Scr1 family TA system antitoxin-like transcriptional regulator [Nocardiopsis sp. CT-R113]
MTQTPFQECLAKFRELAGLTQQQLADRSRTSHSSVNRWKGGSGTPKKDNVALLDEALGAQGALLAAWRRTTEGTGLPEWARDLVSIERSARHLTLVTPALVPGYLQSSEVSRGVFRTAHPLATAEDLARLVKLRTERLGELSDLEVIAVFPVAAVSGLPASLRRTQAAYLLEWVETGRVAVHLVPEGTILLGPTSPLMLFRLRTGELAVVSDHADGNVIHEEPTHDRLSSQATSALAASLPLALSLDVLRTLT